MGHWFSKMYRELRIGYFWKNRLTQSGIRFSSPFDLDCGQFENNELVSGTFREGNADYFIECNNNTGTEFIKGSKYQGKIVWKGGYQWEGTLICTRDYNVMLPEGILYSKVTCTDEIGSTHPALRSYLENSECTSLGPDGCSQILYEVRLEDEDRAQYLCVTCYSACNSKEGSPLYDSKKCTLHKKKKPKLK